VAVVPSGRGGPDGRSVPFSMTPAQEAKHPKEESKTTSRRMTPPELQNFIYAYFVWGRRTCKAELRDSVWVGVKSAFISIGWSKWQLEEWIDASLKRLS
jgi:hypothetical protein